MLILLLGSRGVRNLDRTKKDGISEVPRTALSQMSWMVSMITYWLKCLSALVLPSGRFSLSDHWLSYARWLGPSSIWQAMNHPLSAPPASPCAGITSRSLNFNNPCLWHWYGGAAYFHGLKAGLEVSGLSRNFQASTHMEALPESRANFSGRARFMMVHKSTCPP